MQAANSLALGTSPIVRALFDPEGGMRSVRALDNISFTDWFKSHGGSDGSIKRMWDPIGATLPPLHFFIIQKSLWMHVGPYHWLITAAHSLALCIRRRLRGAFVGRGFVLHYQVQLQDSTMHHVNVLPRKLVPLH